MQLYIHPKGGIAGDMFAAALIDAGADAEKVTGAMQAAAEKLGRTALRYLKTSDGCGRLVIDVEHHYGHLSSTKAFHLLDHLFRELKIKKTYREFGIKVLNHLIKAGKEAYTNYDFDTDAHHYHDYHHSGGEELHLHDQNKEPEAWLHEAQDILIDVMGAVMGLQELSAPTTAQLTCPVSLGGGSVSCSRGTLKVPVPATEMMIRNNNIPVQKGPIETELFTPTGAAVISALNANMLTDKLPDKKIIAQGCSRGTKSLPVEPLKITLYQ
jgi:uncharacterized protein (DUF111 family)